MNNKILTVILGLSCITMMPIAGCTHNNNFNSQSEKVIVLSEDGSNAHITAEATVLDIVNHPAFAGFSRFILPLDNGIRNTGMKLNNIGSLLPYHSSINPDTTVRVINHMIDEVSNGKTIFYDFYTEQQKQEDSTKKATGLFFFRGQPNAPFAVICPGGGFFYVGSVHEGFPYAIELSKKGYNAFVIQYRVGGVELACEDLAMAIAYIFKNADTLEVNTKDYSLWGSSAGARMAAYLGSYGAAYFSDHDLPKPSSVIIAYTGHSDFTKTDPPTFAVVSQNDPIASAVVMERRINAMRNAGIDVEFRKYQKAGHGFGLGIGTDAEGWINYAVEFWKQHIK
ncbi:MAG: alpha/beta hydrolase [Sporomusa sp.]